MSGTYKCRLLAFALLACLSFTGTTTGILTDSMSPSYERLTVDLPMGWTNVTSSYAPPEMAGGVMAFDAHNAQFVLFGGWDGAPLAETWTFDSRPAQWREIQTAHGPAARGDANFAYVNNHQAFVLFGGWYESPPGTYHRYGDTWVYFPANETWVELRPSRAPSPRSDSAIAYDPDHDVVLLFGGFDGTYLGDMWSFSFENQLWTQRVSARMPPPRADGRMVYDTDQSLFYLYAGNDFHGPNYTFNHLDDLWTYDGDTNTWTEVATPASPGARDYHLLAYAPATRELLLVGGYGEYEILGDTWAFDPRVMNWTTVLGSEAPPPRFAAVGGYDEVNHVLLLFGGFATTGLLADTWLLRRYSPALSTDSSQTHAVIAILGAGSTLAAAYLLRRMRFKRRRLESREGLVPELSEQSDAVHRQTADEEATSRGRN